MRVRAPSSSRRSLGATMSAFTGFSLFLDREQQRNRLDRLAEAHVVGEHPARPMSWMNFSHARPASWYGRSVAFSDRGFFVTPISSIPPSFWNSSRAPARDARVPRDLEQLLHPAGLRERELRPLPAAVMISISRSIIALTWPGRRPRTTRPRGARTSCPRRGSGGARPCRPPAFALVAHLHVEPVHPAVTFANTAMGAWRTCVSTRSSGTNRSQSSVSSARPSLQNRIAASPFATKPCPVWSGRGRGRRACSPPPAALRC